MGIKSILSARRILMVAVGRDKAESLYKAVTGAVTRKVPASVLQFHSNVVFVADKAALSKVKGAGISACG